MSDESDFEMELWLGAVPLLQGVEAVRGSSIGGGEFEPDLNSKWPVESPLVIVPGVAELSLLGLGGRLAPTCSAFICAAEQKLSWKFDGVLYFLSSLSVTFPSEKA